MVEPGGTTPASPRRRLEQMFLVTDGGNDVLSPYDVPGTISASRI